MYDTLTWLGGCSSCSQPYYYNRFCWRVCSVATAESVVESWNNSATKNTIINEMEAVLQPIYGGYVGSVTFGVGNCNTQTTV